MPVIKGAKKKLRQDKKRTERNQKLRNAYREALRKVKKAASEKNITAAVSLVDKAAKNHIIHKNKAARLKSRLSKLLPRKTTAAKTPVKKIVLKPKAKVVKPAKPKSRKKTIK